VLSWLLIRVGLPFAGPKPFCYNFRGLRAKDEEERWVPNILTDPEIAGRRRDGFLSPVPVISPEAAAPDVVKLAAEAVRPGR
jgi:hypothetical protein